MPSPKNCATEFVRIPTTPLKGHRIEGLLLNSRMVQATYDDLNPETAPRWAYPDIQRWDADWMRRVLDALDANGMVAILGYFYFGQDQHFRDEAAVIRATDEATVLQRVTTLLKFEVALRLG